MKIEEGKRSNMKKNLKILICAMLAVLMVTAFTACSAESDGGSDADGGASVPVSDGATVGEGETVFPLTITDAEGASITITVKTDEETVGTARQNCGLVEGEDSEYGLYIKTVNGTTLDYDEDGMYWGFYVDGVYAVKSADQTEIASGKAFELKAEAA